MSMSQLDPGQIIKHAYDDSTESIKVKVTTGVLISEPYDEIDLTYVAAGNGVGEIQTVIYKLGGSTVATLTLSYNAQNKLSQVLRS